MNEGYPSNWQHAVIHLNPETGELHSDGDHRVREWIVNLKRAIPVELIVETIETLTHAEIFIKTREKMHPTGQELYKENIQKLQALKKELNI